MRRAELASEHWPGPLTLVVPLRDDAASPPSSPRVCRPSAFACRRIRRCRRCLRAVGRPLAAPSANASGSISPTRAEHVLQEPRRPNRADPRRRPDGAGLESTIVAATGGPLRLLRPGPIDSRLRARRRCRSGIEAPGPTRQPLRAGKAAAARTRPTPSLANILIGFGPCRRRSEPQRLRRSGRSRGAAVRLAARGRRV